MSFIAHWWTSLSSSCISIQPSLLPVDLIPLYDFLPHFYYYYFFNGQALFYVCVEWPEQVTNWFQIGLQIKLWLLRQQQGNILKSYTHTCCNHIHYGRPQSSGKCEKVFWEGDYYRANWSAVCHLPFQYYCRSETSFFATSGSNNTVILMAAPEFGSSVRWGETLD